MIKKGRQPISGGVGQFKPTPNVLSDAADTSRDAQKLVRANPSPFQNRQGPVNVPVGRVNMQSLGIPYGAPGPVNARTRNVGTRVTAGTTAAMLAAVGEPRLPKGYNPINSGFPTRGVQRTVGSGSTPRVSAKQRSQYPGIFGSTKYRP